ncbi:hypothetical protein F2Q69_00063345 [Brassica cretica]|uniref:Uncharacterized protein n=1 Tax=Brassica cretica TaxID=69181 RepID=A0A8S9RJD5_BRACR|nr:hypothetical protein F2Q69_00063345 [Brassica cretica]
MAMVLWNDERRHSWQQVHRLTTYRRHLIFHWVRTLQIPKSQSAAWPSQHKYPASRWLNLSAPGTGFNMDKGWCYVSNSRCTKKFQRMVSSFTCATFNNTTPLVSFVYLLVLMEKCTSYITSELMKLCIFWLERERIQSTHTATPFIAQMAGKTYTFQARDGNDDHGDDMPRNISGPTKVDTDGDDCEEAPTIGTTSTGVDTNKPPATATSKVAKKARIAYAKIIKFFYALFFV